MLTLSKLKLNIIKGNNSLFVFPKVFNSNFALVAIESLTPHELDYVVFYKTQ